MLIKDISKLLDARIICSQNFSDEDFTTVIASDLMSDVLTIDADNSILITGLCTLQTIRTAEMADIKCVIYVRDKKVTDEIKNLAVENEIIILECQYSMFKTAGLLFSNGLKELY